MSENNFSSEWPEVWRRIYTGYRRHISVLKEVLAEQKKLVEQGYGNPTDGFVSAALHVAELENEALWEAQKERDAAALIQCLERNLHGFCWYGEADLSWSAVWKDYQPQLNEWLKDIRRFLELGYKEPERFIAYTGHGWTP